MLGIFHAFSPHQWRNDSELKTARPEVAGSIAGRASQPKRSVFRDFLRSSRKYGLKCHRKTAQEGTLPTGPDPRSGQLALFLHPTTLADNVQTFYSLFTGIHK